MHKLAKIFMAFVVACCCFMGLRPAEAGMISVEQEIKMGKETAQSLEAKYGLSQDYNLNSRVDRIGQRLAAVCGRNDITYSFKVLNCDEVNALACPGGFIYVFKGLMNYMPSDTELASTRPRSWSRCEKAYGEFH